MLIPSAQAKQNVADYYKDMIEIDTVAIAASVLAASRNGKSIIDYKIIGESGSIPFLTNLLHGAGYRLDQNGKILSIWW